MKPGLVGAVAGVAIAVAAVMGGGAALSSCTIDRPSEALKCSTNTDCAPDRLCQSGYCVVGTRPIDARELDAAECPSVCTGGCDFAATKCTIASTGGGNITCPAGWNCDIFCSSAGACGAINCGQAASCKVNCSAANACAAVSCTTKNCDVTCSAGSACGNISCTSGNCTAHCTGADACGDVTCTTGNCTETCGGGSGSAVCGKLSCTTGACQRTCDGGSACDTMTCGGGSCTELCSGGSNACGSVNCGTGKCTSTCQGSDGAASACGDVLCSSSCQCDVNCNDVANNLCPATMTCPDPQGGATNECQDTLGRCDSGQSVNRCQKCP